jgi:hypothetical protein
MNTDLLLPVVSNESLAAAEGAPNDTNVVVMKHRRYRARDIGVGYGRSSGYALDKRYTSDWGNVRFRCA